MPNPPRPPRNRWRCAACDATDVIPGICRFLSSCDPQLSRPIQLTHKEQP